MKLIFIRHGLAEGHFSIDPDVDFQRELTNEGRSLFNKTIMTFKKSEPHIDVIFTSPLARAVQSAELLWTHYKKADLELMVDLHILDDPLHLVEYISLLPSNGTYAFVGHDPHLTVVIASLLALHPEHDFMTIKKGGISTLQGGMWEGFRLELLISPKFLRSLK